MAKLKLPALGIRTHGIHLELSLIGSGPMAYLRAGVVDELKGTEIFIFCIDNGAKLKKFLDTCNECVKRRRAAKD